MPSGVYLRRSREEAFWSYVEKTDTCWFWRGAISHSGYGAFYDEKLISAHRWLWIRLHGPLARGLQVCHHCDVRICVRPDHLFKGTAQDNARDCASKGRLHITRGTQRHNAKLCADDVRRIRAHVVSDAVLAKELGVARETVRDIRLGHSWTHVCS